MQMNKLMALKSAICMGCTLAYAFYRRLDSVLKVRGEAGMELSRVHVFDHAALA